MNSYYELEKRSVTLLACDHFCLMQLYGSFVVLFEQVFFLEPQPLIFHLFKMLPFLSYENGPHAASSDRGEPLPC